MTCTHLTTDELVMIKSYYHQNTSVAQIATFLNRTRTPIYNVINFLKEGHTAIEYYQQYKENKRYCGRHRIVLPMKGKRKPNGHKERRGKQAFKRSIAEREKDYPQFTKEFDHIEGDTIVGFQHKNAIITLLEHLSKVIITLKPTGRKASDIEIAMNR